MLNNEPYCKMLTDKL